jgi:hypothetical protein
MNDSTEVKNDTMVKTLSAMEYFLSRKKQIERYVEGEHKWYGDVDQSVVFNSRPWYLDSVPVSKSESGF